MRNDPESFGLGVVELDVAVLDRDRRNYDAAIRRR